MFYNSILKISIVLLIKKYFIILSSRIVFSLNLRFSYLMSMLVLSQEYKVYRKLKKLYNK